MPIRKYYDRYGRVKGYSKTFTKSDRDELNKTFQLIIPIVVIFFLIKVLLGIFHAFLNGINWVSNYSTYDFPTNIFAWNLYIVFAGPSWIFNHLHQLICLSPLTPFPNLNLVLFVIILILLAIISIAFISFIAFSSKTKFIFFSKIIVIFFLPAVFSITVWIFYIFVWCLKWLFAT